MGGPPAYPLRMALESSLILFKPDAIEKKIVGTVLARFEAAGFAIRGVKMMRLGPAILREHYAHLTHLPFFPEIEAFMWKILGKIQVRANASLQDYLLGIDSAT